ENVTAYSVMKETVLSASIPQEAVAHELQDQVQDGELSYSIHARGLDEKSLRTYASQVGANVERLLDPEQPAAIVVDTIKYQEPGTGKYVETKAIHTKVGQSLMLNIWSSESNQDADLAAIKIAALTDLLPLGVQSAGLGGLVLILSDTVLD